MYSLMLKSVILGVTSNDDHRGEVLQPVRPFKSSRGSPSPPPPTLRHRPRVVSSALAPAPGFMLLRTLRPMLRRPRMPQYPERRRPPRLWLLSLEQLGLTDLRFVLVEWNAADLSCLGLGNFSINFGPLILISICCVGFCSPQFI